MWAAPDRTPQNRVRDRRFWVLISTTFLTGMAMSLYRGVISNYALQELHVGAARFGLLLGAGLWLHTWAGGFGQLILVTLLYSIGLHLWYISRDVPAVDVTVPQERAPRSVSALCGGGSTGPCMC